MPRSTKPRSRLSSVRPKKVRMIADRWEWPTKFPNFWSYSRWAAWRNCAYAYLLGKVMKICIPPQGKAAERGDMIHRLAQAFLEGKTKGLPDELSKFADEFYKLKRLGAVAEGDWTLTEDLRKTHGKDWDGAWLRVRIDARIMMEDAKLGKKKGKKGKVAQKVRTLVIIDYKTGRFETIDVAQMEIYAATAIHYFDFDEVVVELWGLDKEKTEVRVWSRAEAEALWTKWHARGKMMLEDREFKPSPETEKCKKCQYSSANTMTDGTRGPCQAWRQA